MNRERSTNTKLSIEFRNVADIVWEKEGEVKVKERKIKATRKEENDRYMEKERKLEISRKWERKRAHDRGIDSEREKMWKR